MSGSRISDMLASTALPSGAIVPFVAPNGEGGLNPRTNYAYDLGGALSIRAVRCDSINALKALDYSANPVAIFGGVVFSWALGNFNGEVDNVNIIASNNAAITAGAWIRDLSSGWALLSQIPLLTVQGNSLRIAGTASVGDAGAGMTLVYDAAVDAAYVAANPTTSRIDAAGRGFRATYRLPATGAKPRNSTDALQERPYSVKDFGAIGDLTVRAGVDVGGINAAINVASASSVRATVYLPRGGYRLAAGESVALPQSYSHLRGEKGSNIYGSDSPVLKASGASYVISSVKELRLNGGTYGLDVAVGSNEIASIDMEDVAILDYSVGGIRFSNALTSSKFSKLYVNGASGTGAGFECLDGLNNNNVIRDSDFVNCVGPDFRFSGRTNGLLIDNVRVEKAEGTGRAGAAVFNFDRPFGVVLRSGWYEGVHGTLLAINNGDDGVVLDGLVVIGSRYRTNQANPATDTGFIPVQWSASGQRVIFGSNWFDLPTLAPPKCYVYGVNTGLLTDGSLVYTRALKSSEHCVAKKRSFAATGDLTFSFFRATRGDASSNTANQQVVSATMYVTLSCHDGGGVARWAVWKVEFAVRGYVNTIEDPNATITTTLVQGNAGSVTLTVEKSADQTATDADLRMGFSGVNTTLPNYAQYEMGIRNLAATENGRFVVQVF